MLASECMLYTYFSKKTGYAGHRSAYQGYHNLTNDQMPEIVMHVCDVRHCYAEQHLMPGTHQDNMDDMVAKGRQATGDRNAKTKLTEDDVRAIRAEFKAGILTQVMIAEAFGVDRRTIRAVRDGRTWSHVR